MLLTPEDKGAAGDFDPGNYSGTDDAQAINDMFDQARAMQKPDHWGQATFPGSAISFGAGKIYRVNSPINMTGLRAGTPIFGNGACIYSGGINNKPVVDAIWSRGLNIRDLTIYAENGAYSGYGVQPSYGLAVGRKNSDDASEHNFENVRIQGWFNKSSYMNISGELITSRKCRFMNSVAASAFGGLAIHVTDTNEAGFTSDFQTMGTLPAFGMNENLFDQCNINSSQAGAIRLNGKTRSLKFHQSYAAVASAFPAVTIKGDHDKLELDLHVETTNALANLEFDMSASSLIRGLIVRDHESQAAVLMKRSGPGNGITILNGHLDIPSFFQSGFKVVASGSGINYHGDILLGKDSVPIRDLTGFNSLRGDLWTAGINTGWTLPGSGYVRIRGQEEFPGYYGIQGKALKAFQAIHGPTQVLS